MSGAFWRNLARCAARPYRAAGRYAWHFAQGKLGGDPVFRGLLERQCLPDHARVLDLGCGQGLLAAWLWAARREFEAGRWPSDLGIPPILAAYQGVELMPCDAERARRALGGGAEIMTGDIRGVVLAAADVVVILDVLHFLDYPAQRELLTRVRAALEPAGILLLRVGDAGSGWAFRYSLLVDHVVAALRGYGLGRLYCRSHADWTALLREVGFEVESWPMSQGTPFANVLLVARLKADRSVAVPATKAAAA